MESKQCNSLTIILNTEVGILLFLGFLRTATDQIFQVIIPVTPIYWNTAVQTALLVTICEEHFWKAPIILKIFKAANKSERHRTRCIWKTVSAVEFCGSILQSESVPSSSSGPSCSKVEGRVHISAHVYESKFFFLFLINFIAIKIPLTCTSVITFYN